MKKVYIVVSHTFKPADGECPNQKAWKEGGKWESNEQIEVVKNLKNRHLTEAGIIIDVLEMKYLKNRLANVEGVTEEQMTENLVFYIEQNKAAIQAVLGYTKKLSTDSEIIEAMKAKDV